MSYVKYLLGLLLLLATPLQAQNQKLPPPPQMQWEFQGNAPPGSNIIFVVDTSGSMDGRQVQDAITTVLQIAECPLDDLQIAIVTFGSSTRRWPGVVDRNPQNEMEIMSRNRWALSNPENLAAANAWMQENRDGGGTNANDALLHAFQSCGGGPGNETVRQLSIIIISDGDIGVSEISALRETITSEQRARDKANLTYASIGFVGVDVTEGDNAQIKSLFGNRVTDGVPDGEEVWEPGLADLGYYRLIYRPIIEEEEDLPPPAFPDPDMGPGGGPY